jgi:hypothetical protein
VAGHTIYTLRQSDEGWMVLKDGWPIAGFAESDQALAFATKQMGEGCAALQASQITLEAKQGTNHVYCPCFAPARPGTFLS